MIFTVSAQESRVGGWKTVPAKAEPSEPAAEGAGETPQEGEKSEAKNASEAGVSPDPLSELKAHISARAEALAELEKREKNIDELEKSLTPLERKAFRQLKEEAEARRKRELRDMRARIESNLSGCEKPEEVWVNDDFVAVRTWRVNAKILIRNTSGVTIDEIVIGGIPAVKNLCPGGALTLTRKLNTWQDGNSPRIIFSAQGTLEDGTVATSEKRVYLSVWQAEQELSKQETWDICLRGSRCRN